MNRREPRGDPPLVVTKPPTAGQWRRFSTRRHSSFALIQERRPELPVMMVTAYGDDERRRRATEFGAMEFVSKPVDFDPLKSRLQQLPAALG
jgi:DNA-binding NtrC family response regulator